jgi:hypothetical protein
VTTDRLRLPRPLWLGIMLVTTVGALMSPIIPAGIAQAAPCENGGGYVHDYAYSHSGMGTNKGTGADALTWTHWSLNGHPASDEPISNEAVWVEQNNNVDNESLEVGFKTGWVPATGGISNSMYPYYTIYDDQNPTADEFDFTGTSLPTDTVIWDSATSNGSSSWAYVNNKLIGEIGYYGIGTPRVDYEQTEVNYQDIWMGGGSQSSMYLYYQTPSNAWDEWGYADSATDSYNIATGATGTFPSSWYGIETTQPDYTLQGGYGASC